MERIRRAFVCALVLLAGLALVPASGAEDRGAGQVVSGQVKDSSGGVIVGALVTLSGGGGVRSRDATTDAKGAYRIEGVGPGTYLLTAYKDRFAAASQEVKVVSAPAAVDFTLSPAGYAEEVTVSFTGEHARTALKTDAAEHDIPLTVKSYTGSFVRAIDTKAVSELYTYMNGVNRAGNGAYDTTIRGYSGGEPNSISTDGMPGLPARLTSPNISNVERIELLKGPASVLYGRASPGGLLNIITKRPQATPMREVEVRGATFAAGDSSLGDDNSYRINTDFTGPLGASKKVLYRLVFSYDNVRSFRTDVKSDDLFIVPSVSFNFGEGTLLTLDGEYRRVNTVPDNGLIAPLNDIDFIAARTVHYQEPGDSENETGWSANARLSRQFSPRTALSVTWRSVVHEDERKAFENVTITRDNKSVTRRDRDQLNHRQYHYLDTYLTQTARTGSVSHSFLFGLNGGYELRDFDRLRFNAQGFAIDLYNPVYGRFQRPATPSPGFHQNYHLYDYAGYVQDRLDIGSQWKALVSARYTGAQSHFKELRLVQPSRERTLGAFLPMLGLVYQPDPRWSLYGSYANSYDPQNVTAVDAQGNNNFDPERGRQFEGGVKSVLWGGRAEATAATFFINKKNVLLSVGPGISQQIGANRSRGFEFDLRLKPLVNWQMILGYAYTDARVTKDVNPIVVGAPLINTAKNAFNGWMRYDVTSGAARGLGFGLGVIYRGVRPGTLPAQVVVTGTPTPGAPLAQRALLLPAYFRTDAGLYFTKNRYEATLRINNVFDEHYYENAFNVVSIIPGNPRELTFSTRVRF
jgi:iron complex outermembrane receptor protein